MALASYIYGVVVEKKTKKKYIYIVDPPVLKPPLGERWVSADRDVIRGWSAHSSI